MPEQPSTRTQRTDAETERLTLAAAVEHVRQHGLGTSLAQLTFDDIVRRAGVSRTSAYRRWPRREAFLQDVLLQLAQGADLRTDRAGAFAMLRHSLVKRRRELLDERSRQDVLIDTLRALVQSEIDEITGSPAWQTFLALSASFQTLGDDELRGRIGQALHDSDRRFQLSRGRTYGQVCALLRFRLRPPWLGPEGFEAMAAASGIAMMGVLAKSPARPDLMLAGHNIQAFGSGQATSWSLAAYAVAASMLAFAEPDPTAIWTEHEVANLLNSLDRLTNEAPNELG